MRSLRRFILVLLVLSLSTARHVSADECGGSVDYDVQVNFSFVPAVDPLIPSKGRAQIPSLVAVVHSPDIVLFRLSQRLNDSVAEVASRGTSSNLESELNDLQDKGAVASYEIISSRDQEIPVDGSLQLRLTARDAATRLSIIAHLSPSPAWFTGVDAYALCQETTDKNEFAYILSAGNITFGNYDAGLDKGQSFEADPDPYAEGDTAPVSTVDTLTDVRLAVLSLEIRPRSLTWWKVFVGVLAAVIVISFVSICIYPRCFRKKKTEDIPLTQSNTEW